MPSSPVTRKTFDAHIDRLTAVTPAYTSHFSSFRDSSKDNSKAKSKDVFPVTESERSAARAAASTRTNQFYDIVTRSYERG